ncbi:MULTISPECIES: lipocalin-like domain-containing protein [Marivita]|uniref:Iron ABC transporter permease n=1 Tax=Marivita cryptomonadis TaxID=505252 RepID=A0A9Q2NSV1_9RHOB|nr:MULTISPECIES: lipocalin-like domain-containing protein [Marivita]MCR9167696.1 iron ABC transporter permease [Paracoccaceae bacterium]MBM2322101.1 iron ABC transporter permease [Marivita cryptomonadis]MBM2331682.1 iron ABC transporter permease [Marivita cryptomonadis]MBM2341267.1 iron ABC transporter permease [Marivita cryptomonadis]MBM2345930.1 iron ABC transporter permease [Marivita cryptomonadis]
MIVRAFLLILWLPVQAMAQGFAGLGTDAEGFAVPTPNPVFDFPQDHGAHPDYRIEWWYLTANLTGPDGTAYGVQWTLFRSALAPETREGWSDPQVWFAHAAVTTPDTHLVAERIARGGIGQAGVTVQPFEAWIDDWRMAGASFDDLTLTARGDAFAYDLGLTANGPLIFHGDTGFSVKSAQGQASYYYSQPFYEVSGTLTLPQGDVPVTGAAWLDREWSSQPLADSQSGWDWFSLSFATGDKLMGFLLREDDGASFSSATWIAADGTTTSYADGAFAAQPLDWSKVSGRDVPTRWAVQLPDKGIDVTVTALNPNAWMALSIPYWEGPVTVEGSHTGRGYLEMTGYE